MMNKLKDPGYYFKVRTVWPNILYGKSTKQPKRKRISGMKLRKDNEDTIMKNAVLCHIPII